MAENMVYVNDTNFDKEVLKDKGVVLVDFFAEWCGPCKMIGPVVSQLADEYAGKAKIAKLDVDKAQMTSMKYRVMGVPTLIFFKDGKEFERIVGARPKGELDRILKQATA